MNQPPQFPQFQAPGQAPVAPVPAPQYVPGYAPMPGQSAPQPFPGQLPQPARAAFADVDSVGDEDSQYPKCTYSNGAPWYLAIQGACKEQVDNNDNSTTFWITATVRQSPDPAFATGMTVSVPIKKLGHPKYNNTAQSRLRDFLAACCGDAKIGMPPGHFAGRKQQALTGVLNGGPFVVTFSERTHKTAKDEKTGLPVRYTSPSFQAG